MKKYKAKFKDYLEDLGKKRPSPGGGSAVCLTFCLGVSLIEKALNYSLDKNARFKKYLDRLKTLKRKIYIYIDRDGEIFEQILRTSGRKRIDFIRKSERIIIDTAEACILLFSLAKKVESGIKKGIISDFYIGRNLLKIVLKGCIYNLEANQRIFKRESKSIAVFKRFLKKSKISDYTD